MCRRETRAFCWYHVIIHSMSIETSSSGRHSQSQSQSPSRAELSSVGLSAGRGARAEAYLSFPQHTSTNNGKLADDAILHGSEINEQTPLTLSEPSRYHHISSPPFPLLSKEACAISVKKIPLWR